jgi:hypothetical protein
LAQIGRPGPTLATRLADDRIFIRNFRRQATMQTLPTQKIIPVLRQKQIRNRLFFI